MAEVDSLARGTFELADRGGGHLRSAKRGYLPHPTDTFVPPDLARRSFLRGGEDVEGEVDARQSKGRHQPPKLAKIVRVNGLEPEDFAERTPFEDLVAIDPQQAVQFEIPGGSPSMRVIDLLMPIGLGQRGLIAAPPRTGKTVLLQQMAAGIAANHPDVYMMVLLIDERPEEVTEMRRTVHGEVAASSSDRDAASHVRMARLMIANRSCSSRVPGTVTGYGSRPLITALNATLETFSPYRTSAPTTYADSCIESRTSSLDGILVAVFKSTTFSPDGVSST